MVEGMYSLLLLMPATSSWFERKDFATVRQVPWISLDLADQDVLRRRLLGDVVYRV
jgi:hypothetical protein